MTLTDNEHAEIADAAEQARLAKAAFLVEAALAAARGEAGVGGDVLREALAELMRASGLARRAGVNLNQAVRALNSTGEQAGDLGSSALWCMRMSRRMDMAAAEVVRRLP